MISPADNTMPLRSYAPPQAEMEPISQEPVDALANPLLIVHRLLRGRYKWAILLGLIAAVGGAYLGWRSQKPVYTSTGTIRIKAVLPRILYSTGQNQMMPMFGSYVDFQASLLKSQRAAEMAMQTPAWESLKRGMSPAAVSAFEGGLSIKHRSGTQLIYVLYSSHNPKVARIGARAVVAAYKKLYGEGDYARENMQMQVLQERRAAVQNQQRSTHEQIAAVAGQFGPDALTSIYKYKIQIMDRLNARWELARLAVLQRGKEKPGPKVPHAKRWTVKRIMRHDPEIRALQAQVLGLKSKIKSMELFGVTARNPRVRKLQAALQATRLEVKQYAATYQPLQDIQYGVKAHRSLKQLRAAEVRLGQLYQQIRTQALALGVKYQKIQDLRRREKALRAQMTSIKNRVEQINIESGAGGRIDVISRGDAPQVTRDLRKPAAAAGGLAGMAMGFGIVFLWGLFNQRLRNVGDAEASNFQAQRILGAIPQLSARRAGPLDLALAAHSVHSIRALLQVGAGGGPHSLAVTSPAPGSGKTSIVLALGMSYAASGARTLLIDCDVVGGQLTERLGIPRRRRLGEILVRENLVSARQLQEALAAAQQSQRRVGSELQSMGYLEPKALSRALNLQQRSACGLMDAIEGKPLDRCVVKTKIHNLFVLPLGRTKAHHGMRMSPNTIRRMIAEAANRYDMIILDTGPIIGSVEASLAASQADATVLVISRGEQHDAARRATDQLNAIGARLSGIVFNRAPSKDLQGVTSNASTYLLRSAGNAVEPGEEISMDEKLRERYRRLGPLPFAVALSNESPVPATQATLVS